MDEQPGVSDEVRLSSPWPMFVALGLTLSEVGIVLNLIPISVGGLLLFAGSVAGIVQDAGYVSRPWSLLGTLGAVLVVLGAILVVTQVTPSVGALVDAVAAATTPDANGIVQRGLSVVLAGLVCLVGGVVGRATGRRGIEAA
ncbi:cox cluster protein [Halomarina salina]|uniref:Cox cluster protein n=1 Tax=Halomarina salina TaxID=1872699 RepID=A0ABD5RIP4_9EURY|nr:cox cluster protein [Halomarina salina]